MRVSARAVNLPAVRKDPADPPGGPATAAWAPPVRWAVLRSPPSTGARNMAVDLALLDRAAGAGAATWRCYGWSRPTVSLGRNEPAAGRLDPEALAAAGVDLVRRPTGGRALLHTREVTYAAAFPLPPGVPWRVAYAAVNGVLLEALRALGVPAALAPPRPRDGEARAVAGPCFTAPDEGEVVAGGSKLVGSAVWRERGAYLQHGSILLHDDQPRLAALLGEPVGRAAALSALLGREVAPAEVADRLEAALTDAARAGAAASHGAPPSVTGFAADPSWDETIATWEARLGDPAWLWRR